MVRTVVRAARKSTHPIVSFDKTDQRTLESFDSPAGRTDYSASARHSDRPERSENIAVAAIDRISGKRGDAGQWCQQSSCGAACRQSMRLLRSPLASVRLCLRVAAKQLRCGDDVAVFAHVLEPHRDALRDARLFHRDAVERVGAGHRLFRMRDDDELREREKLAQHADEAADVRFVEGGVDFVEDAERAGLAAKHR